MQHLIERLVSIDPAKIQEKKNNSPYYLTFRKDAKEFEFELAASAVQSCLLGKKVSVSPQKFESRCADYLRGKLSDDSVLDDLMQMYFSSDALSRTAPEFMLLRTQKGANTSTKHLVELLKSFFRETTTNLKFEGGTNFLEKGFLELLREEMRDEPLTTSEECYLPFVAKSFVRDVTFLSKHSEYFLEQLPNCIELYNFIYCSQLGLNIRNWTSGGEPESKPLYFILDTEKFSSERTRVAKDGYRGLASPMADVFPILSMLEYLNANSEYPKSPLWEYSKAMLDAGERDQKKITESLASFSEEFRKKRELEAGPLPSNPIEAMKLLMKYGVRQFAKSVNQNRYDMQQNYMKGFHEQVARSFLQAKGRAGRVLVINQDFVLLLTNLAVGDRQSVRFQELLGEFRSRGFYFDKGSQQALINFYERVGNVDRMSDSGDAVYVRNTI